MTFLITTFVLGGTTTVVQAAGASRANGQSLPGVTSSGSVWLGSLYSPSGTGMSYAWCIEAGATIPSSAGSSSVMRAPRLSYALERWSTTNYPGASKDQTHAALSYLTHSNYDIGSNGVSAASRRAAFVSATPSAIKTIAKKMWDQAGDYAGDYAAKLTLTKTSPLAASITDVGVKSDASKWTAGYAGVVTLTGPARFSSGESVKTFTTATSAKSYSVVFTGPGTVKATVKISGLPSSTTTRWTGGSSAVQDFLTRAETTESASATLAAPAVKPVITTVAAAITETTNALVLKDSVKINADPAFEGQQVQLTARAYNHGTAAPAQQATVPAGKTPIDLASTVVTLNSSGDATWTTPNLNAPKQSGSYTFVISNSEALGGLLAASQTAYGVPVETVRWTPSPNVTTTASTDAPDAGMATVVRDTVLISGMPANTSITVRGQLWQHPEGENISQTASVPTGAVKEGGEQVATVTTSATGTATVKSSVKVPAKTYTADYTWVTSIDAIPGVMATRYVSPYGVATETVNIERLRERAPIVSTQASTQTARPGETITDTFRINRNDAPLDAFPLVVTSRLWHTTEEPVANQPITDITGAQVVSEATAPGIDSMDDEKELFGINPNTITTDPSLAGGWWVYTYSYAATGDWADDTIPEEDKHDGYPGVTDTVAYATETVMVPWTPVVTTTATPGVSAPGKVGDTIADIVRVTGGKPGSDVEIALKAYAPTTTPPVQRSLDPADTAGTPVTIHTETVTVHLGADGAGTEAAAGFEAAQPGYYPWTETLTAADPGTTGLGVESDYGVPSELAVIAWQPAVTTNASLQVAVAGTPLFDDFTVTGLPPATTVEVVHTVYCSPTEPVRSSTIPANATKAGSVTTTVTSDTGGTVTGRSATFPAPACAFVVWTETIRSADPLVLPWTSDFGISTEITGIVSVITHARPYAAAGTTTFDTAVVTGPVPAGSVLYFDAYQQADGNVDQDELIGTVGPVDVTGPGSYDSPTVSLGEEATKVYFRERLYLPGTDGGIDLTSTPAITGEPRLPGETTTVVTVSSTATEQAQVDTEFTDTAHVEGDVPTGTTVTFDLYEHTGGDDAVLTEHGYEGDTLLLTTKAVAVEGPGDVISPEVTVDHVATVYWVERVYLPGESEPVVMGQHRLANETTMVTLTPPAPSKPSPPELAQTGATIWALLALSGGMITAGIWAATRRKTGLTD